MALVVAVVAYHRAGGPLPGASARTAGDRAPAAVAAAADAREDAALAAIESGTDHIAPEELLDRLLRGEGPLVIDVRPEEEFAAWHLPGAVRMSVPEVVGGPGRSLLDADPGRLAVLCSNGPGHPGQAWLALARCGRENVRVLDGGLDELLERCLTPPSLRGPISEADARRGWPLFAARRAFVLGESAPRPGAGRFATDPERLSAPTVVSPRWLATRLSSAVVIDARESAEDWRRVRIPGALHLAHPALRIPRADGKPHALLSAEAIATKLGTLGIDREAEVVLYADERVHDATLVALALLRAGHERLALLEGGVLAWAAARLPLEVDARPPEPRAARRYEPRPGADDFTATLEEVAAASRGGGAAIVDARPARMYRGEEATEARPGHIPGARNRDLALDTVRTPTGTFWRPRDELLSGYAACGVAPEGAAIASCRTGHSASGAFFAMRFLLGNGRARWYNGSWTEWAEHGELAAETGPGAAPGGRAP
jgi:thiosulfate/3-mercaptopyruvate sulfurtransferase